ncbi:rod shape-determining protein MreD [Roseivivax sediminis]|uniref:Rod shape-determining protein MreD n=1 Tax=Roseivivax sediminis TaxID=936889 RepID=A0A1I2ATB0_9RHOB|nr:rod shape-determining protein MreD [Roseivivax sediminis]SFE47142.1 rod shape-determining protein MreD [Roseivivax sediminis]
MIDAALLRLWAMRALYVALCLIVMFFSLLPLDMSPARIAGPDLIVALTFAWALRRPDIVPTLLVALMALLADLIFQRPPGLWAALTVTMTESLKARDRHASETAFALEWVSVSVGLIVMALIYQIVLLLLIIPTANGALMLSQTILTILCYPVVVAVTHVVFGLRRARPGEGDRIGLGS